MPDSSYSRSLDAAVGYLELGMIEDALEELRQLPGDLRHEAEVLEMEAAIGQQTGRWELAAAALEELCGQPAASVEQFIEWGCCLYELGRIDASRTALLRAPVERHQHGLWHYHLACYESLSGATAEARRLIHRALSLEPRLRRLAEANENVALLMPPG